MNRRTLVTLSAALTTGGLAGCLGGDAGSAPDDCQQNTTEPEQTDGTGLVTQTLADTTVDDTIERIKDDIEASEQLSLVATLDHSANAATADLELPPTVLLLFGNPAAGTPLMQAKRTIGVDLPQRMLVWNADGETRVTYNDPIALANKHGIEGQTDRLEQIRSVLDSIATGKSE